MPKEVKYFECICHNEILRAERTHKDMNTISFAIYTLGTEPKKRSFFNRLKYAWWHIITGKIYNDEIVLDFDSLKELRYYIDKVINS